MTAVRLSPLQRQVLDQLAHIRVAPEDAWMTSERLAQLNASVYVHASLLGLKRRGFVEFDRAVKAWRITDKGREALG